MAHRAQRRSLAHDVSIGVRLQAESTLAELRATMGRAQQRTKASFEGPGADRLRLLLVRWINSLRILTRINDLDVFTDGAGLLALIDLLDGRAPGKPYVGTLGARLNVIEQAFTFLRNRRGFRPERLCPVSDFAKNDPPSVLMVMWELFITYGYHPADAARNDTVNWLNAILYHYRIAVDASDLANSVRDGRVLSYLAHFHFPEALSPTDVVRTPLSIGQFQENVDLALATYDFFRVPVFLRTEDFLDGCGGCTQFIDVQLQALRIRLMYRLAGGGSLLNKARPSQTRQWAHTLSTMQISPQTPTPEPQHFFNTPSPNKSQRHNLTPIRMRSPSARSPSPQRAMILNASDSAQRRTASQSPERHDQMPHVTIISPQGDRSSSALDRSLIPEPLERSSMSRSPSRSQSRGRSISPDPSNKYVLASYRQTWRKLDGGGVVTASGSGRGEQRDEMLRHAEQLLHAANLSQSLQYAADTTQDNLPQPVSPSKSSATSASVALAASPGTTVVPSSSSPNVLLGSSLSPSKPAAGSIYYSGMQTASTPVTPSAAVTTEREDDEAYAMSASLNGSILSPETRKYALKALEETREKPLLLQIQHLVRARMQEMLLADMSSDDEGNADIDAKSVSSRGSSAPSLAASVRSASRQSVHSMTPSHVSRASIHSARISMHSALAPVRFAESSHQLFEYDTNPTQAFAELNRHVQCYAKNRERSKSRKPTLLASPLRSLESVNKSYASNGTPSSVARKLSTSSVGATPQSPIFTRPPSVGDQATRRRVSIKPEYLGMDQQRHAAARSVADAFQQAARFVEQRERIQQMKEQRDQHKEVVQTGLLRGIHKQVDRKLSVDDMAAAAHTSGASTAASRMNDSMSQSHVSAAPTQQSFASWAQSRGSSRPLSAGTAQPLPLGIDEVAPRPLMPFEEPSPHQIMPRKLAPEMEQHFRHIRARMARRRSSLASMSAVSGPTSAPVYTPTMQAAPSQPYGADRPYQLILDHWLSPEASLPEPRWQEGLTPGKKHPPAQPFSAAITDTEAAYRDVLILLNDFFANDYRVIWVVDYAAMALFYNVENYALAGSSVMLGVEAATQGIPVIASGYKRDLCLASAFFNNPTQRTGDGLALPVPCMMFGAVPSAHENITGYLRAVTAKDLLRMYAAFPWQLVPVQCVNYKSGVAVDRQCFLLAADPVHPVHSQLLFDLCPPQAAYIQQVRADMYDNGAAFGQQFDEQSYLPGLGDGEHVHLTNVQTDANGLARCQVEIDGVTRVMVHTVEALVEAGRLPRDAETIIM